MSISESTLVEVAARPMVGRDTDAFRGDEANAGVAGVRPTGGSEKISKELSAKSEAARLDHLRGL